MNCARCFGNHPVSRCNIPRSNCSQPAPIRGQPAPIRGQPRSNPSQPRSNPSQIYETFPLAPNNLSDLDGFVFEPNSRTAYYKSTLSEKKLQTRKTRSKNTCAPVVKVIGNNKDTSMRMGKTYRNIRNISQKRNKSKK